MSSGYDFGEDNDVVESGIEEGVLQWFSQRDCEGAEDTTVGWHIEAGKYPYLDKVCAAANLPQVKIEQSKLNTYWQIGGKAGASLFILAKGCHSEQEMNDKSKRAGVAFGWHKEDDGKGKVKNVKTLKFRAFVAELLPFFDESNPPRPVIVVAKNQFASDMLPILGRDGQYRVLRANNELFQEKHGKATKTPYWGFSLLLVPGKRIKRMQVKGDQGSPVSPIVSEIPAQVDDDYLDAHHVGEYLPLIKGEIEDSVAWSLQVTNDIYAGVNGSTEEPENFTEASMDASDFGENFDHPFDSEESVAKPAAKPQPSNSLKPLPDAELGNIVGTANMPQRRALQRLGQLGLAQKAGLSREEAGREIQLAQKR